MTIRAKTRAESGLGKFAGGEFALFRHGGLSGRAQAAGLVGRGCAGLAFTSIAVQWEPVYFLGQTSISEYRKI
jgi:hypothetical protein